MRIRFLLCLLLFLFLGTVSEAQLTRYTIQLKNKGNASFTLANPSQYLSARAIARRQRYGIAIDSSDLPVTPAYLAQIRSVSTVTVLNASRWLNQVTIQTTDAAALSAIQGFSFVQSVSAIAARQQQRQVDRNETTQPYLPVVGREMGTDGVQADYFDYGSGSYNEIHLHNGEFLHNIGLRGQGMQIAMLDAGFLNYTSLRAFDSIRINGQVLSTWDFVAREASVVEDHVHGMQCLSTIAANIPGQFIGKAPKASFHLYRTEDAASEYPIEEFNWVCAAERADSIGADVISSSLGYYDFDRAQFNYAYSDMNGRNSTIVKGAAAAVRKGLLVFNSAGNEGTNAWHYIATPADGDSVIAVGAVNTSGSVWPSSSYGPSADGRVKPDIASVGWQAMIQTTSNTVAVGNGTSFAAPNMAGMGTCLWQGFPEFNNMKIVSALRKSGHRSATPDDRTGYGIPNLKQAFGSLVTDYATSDLSFTDCSATLNWRSKDVSTMKYEIERKLPGESSFTKIAEKQPEAGTILANHSYQFQETITQQQSGAVIAYRIRQIIDTSIAGFTAVYIDTATATLTRSCIPVNPDPEVTDTRIIVQPNPATGDHIDLVVETTDAIPQLNIVLFDVKGRQMGQWQLSKGMGRAVFNIPSGNLARGTYIIRVADKGRIIGKTKFLFR
ncbi:S8 family peptidase [Nostoc ellipsosporum NOK]|nr:S8 family peptidase [Nostoc ellipsosporum NOK]